MPWDRKSSLLCATYIFYTQGPTFQKILGKENMCVCYDLSNVFLLHLSLFILPLSLLWFS